MIKEDNNNRIKPGIEKYNLSSITPREVYSYSGNPNSTPIEIIVMYRNPRLDV